MPPRIDSRLLEAVADIATDLTQPGDPIASNTSSPPNSGPGKAIDNDPNTLYEAFDADLVAYWDFNDNSNSGSSTDSIAGHVGTFQNSAGYTPDGGGRTGALGNRALDCPDGSDRMNVFAVGFLNTAAADDKITISYWQKLDAVALATPVIGVSPTSPSSRGIRVKTPANTSGEIHFDTAGANTPTTRASGPPPAGTNWLEWNHIAVIKNGSQKQVWVNGQLAFTGENQVAMPTDMTVLQVGATTSGSNAAQIDDFAIFSRALSQGEIAQIAQTGIPSPEASLTMTHPGGPAVATEMQLTWSADPTIGPTAFVLEGSKDGSTYVPIDGGFLSRPLGPGSQLARLPLNALGAFAHHRISFSGSLYRPSVAIPEVELVYAPAADQRGSSRLSDADGDRIERYDIGAVETRGWLVNTAADENDGPLLGEVSLRDAVDASGSSDIISFDPVVFDGETGDTVVLTNGELSINSKTLAIDADAVQDGVTVSGNDTSRIFLLGGSGDRYLRNLTLRDGSTDRGGALRANGGNLTLDHVTITENSTTNWGGGMYVSGSATAHIQDSTISEQLHRHRGRSDCLVW